MCDTGSNAAPQDKGKSAENVATGHPPCDRNRNRNAAAGVEDWEAAEPITVLHVCAPNSASGNPRRCYAVLCRSRVLAVVDEGYEGTGALRSAGWGDAVPNIVGDVDVSVKEYKRWLTRGNADRAVA